MSWVGDAEASSTPGGIRKKKRIAIGGVSRTRISQNAKRNRLIPLTGGTSGNEKSQTGELAAMRYSERKGKGGQSLKGSAVAGEGGLPLKQT